MRVVFGFAAVLSVCTAVPIEPLLARLQGETIGFASAKRVLVVGVDGFGGMYLENATSFLPTFNHLISNGATTMRARNQMPTVSAPNWCTTITGMAPEESGVFSNDWVPADDGVTDPTVELMPPISGFGKLPQTMWDVAKQQNPNLKIAVSTSWDWITFLANTSSVDFLNRGMDNDDNTTQAMANFITENQPHVMFVHLDNVDEAGHGSYWGSPLYYAAAKTADTNIGVLLEALTNAGILEETLVIVTADHGGWRGGHGQNNQACFYIPAIFYGAGVKAGQLNTYITNRDFAPTALYALGLSQGDYMLGRVVREAFAL